ncbi:MAG: hypothetical protein PHQ40_08775 [Anaerolineaceae bacterium]|nr:hypothetical protein [Anaerolineaceae bacterium]
MNVITNDRLIQRNRKIGQYTTIGSLAVLGLGLYLSFNPQPQTITLSFVALLVGFVLSQVGIYFGNRWGRTPRTDQVLTSGLKGLSENYTLYNYASPVPHLLLGTTGLWVLIPYHVTGKIEFSNGRWRQKGGNLYLKFFAQNNLGRPDLEIENQTESIKRLLSKKLPDTIIPDVKAVLVFFNEKATVEVDDAPTPTLPVKKLKDFLRKRPKDTSLTPEKLRVLEAALAN